MNATWFDNELFCYTAPDSLIYDRAKRLWLEAYQNRQMQNLESLFNLEIEPLWEELSRD